MKLDEIKCRIAAPQPGEQLGHAVSAAGPKERSRGNPLVRGTSPSPNHPVTGAPSPSTEHRAPSTEHRAPSTEHRAPSTELSLGARRPCGIDERHPGSLGLEVIAVG
jgi:hypothetical protein